jgi:TetR/AcrR family transcriptional regulator
MPRRTTAVKAAPATLRGRSRRRANVRDKETAIAAILSAAASEFARYGLPGARVEAMAKAAGVTKGLIYHYFESKEHLFEAVLRLASNPLRALLSEVESSDASPAELLQVLVDRLLRAIAADPLPHLNFVLESIQNGGAHYRKLKTPSLHNAIKRVLAKGAKQGCFRKLDTTHAAINIVGLCMFYFCIANLVASPELRKPLDDDALARHAREVMRFVEAGTMRRIHR